MRLGREKYRSKYGGVRNMEAQITGSPYNSLLLIFTLPEN